jgi:hypothetical protein
MRLEKPRLEPLSGLRRAFSYLEGRVTAMDVVLDTANDTEQKGCAPVRVVASSVTASPYPSVCRAGDGPGRGA